MNSLLLEKPVGISIVTSFLLFFFFVQLCVKASGSPSLRKSFWSIWTAVLREHNPKTGKTRETQTLS